MYIYPCDLVCVWTVCEHHCVMLLLNIIMSVLSYLCLCFNPFDNVTLLRIGFVLHDSLICEFDRMLLHVNLFAV